MWFFRWMWLLGHFLHHVPSLVIGLSDMPVNLICSSISLYLSAKSTGIALGIDPCSLF